MKGTDSATAMADSSNLQNGTSTGTDKTFRSQAELLDSIADVSQECPLCMENLDIDDVDFFPCSCGYQVCRFCWHRLKNDENGLCPACRQLYPDSPIHFSSISIERVEELKKAKKKQKEKAKLKDNSKANLATLRVVQKNLLFVIGFSQRLSQDDLRKEFSKYGKIIKMVINPSSAYVTYTKAEDAVAAIKSLNELSSGGSSTTAGKNGTSRSSSTTTMTTSSSTTACSTNGSAVSGISSLRASLGTTKYCTHWLRSQSCPKQPDCMYLHEVADHEASFTKEEMQVGKHTEYEKRLIAYYLDVIAKEKDGGGSTGGAKSSSPVNTTSVNGKTSSNQPTQLSSSPPGLQQNSSSTTTSWNGHQPYQHNGSSSQLSSSQAYQEGRSSSSVTVAKSSSSTSVYSNGKGSEQSISSKNSSKQVYGAKSKNSSHQESGDYQHSNIHSMESVSSNQQYSENGRRKNNSANSKESTPETTTNVTSNPKKTSSGSIKITGKKKGAADSNNHCSSSSSGASSLSSTPNQTEGSGPCSAYSSSCSQLSSATSSLNLCTSSDSASDSGAASSASSTPDNIIKENASSKADQSNKSKGEVDGSKLLESTEGEGVLGAEGLLDDDGLDFDPISITTRALEDMLRTMNFSGPSLTGAVQPPASSVLGSQNAENVFGSSSLFNGGRQPAPSSVDSLFGSLFGGVQQASSQKTNLLDDFLETAYKSVVPNQQPPSNNNSSLFNSLHHSTSMVNGNQPQQQQSSTSNGFGLGLFNSPNSPPRGLQGQTSNSPPTASSLLQQQQLLGQIQQLQQHRAAMELQQQQQQARLFAEKKQVGNGLFGNAGNGWNEQTSSGSQLPSPGLASPSSAGFGISRTQPGNHQQHHHQAEGAPPAKLWQQNSLRQLLPTVNIKFGQPGNGAGMGVNGLGGGLSEDDLAAIASFGINPFTGQQLSNNNHHNNQQQHPSQSMSPSALNAAAAASFFGASSTNGSSQQSQGLRSPMNSASASSFWPTNDQHSDQHNSHHSPPLFSAQQQVHHPNHHQNHQGPVAQRENNFFAQQQQQQMLRLQQQARQQQLNSNVGNNFNSLFGSLNNHPFAAHHHQQSAMVNQSGSPSANMLNRPPPGF